jgi:hypothetical protein
MNKRTYLEKYAMPLLEEIFNALGQAKNLNTLDLRYGYHQLPLKEGDCEATFSMYSRFYEVTMLKSTNVISERKMQMYF